MGVSINGGIPKSSLFNGMFHYKPSIIGYSHLWKPPYLLNSPDGPADVLRRFVPSHLDFVISSGEKPSTSRVSGGLNPDGWGGLIQSHWLTS